MRSSLGSSYNCAVVVLQRVGSLFRYLHRRCLRLAHHPTELCTIRPAGSQRVVGLGTNKDGVQFFDHLRTSTITTISHCIFTYRILASVDENCPFPARMIVEELHSGWCAVSPRRANRAAANTLHIQCLPFACILTVDKTHTTTTSTMHKSASGATMRHLAISLHAPTR
jgi:hypothetical protein